MKYDQLWAKANNPKYVSYPLMKVLLRHLKDALETDIYSDPSVRHYIPDIRYDVQVLINVIDSQSEKKKENK